MEHIVFENLRRRRSARARLDLIHLDAAAVLRQMGLNPDDFRDAFDGRRSSVLFTPFRHPRHD